MVQNQVVGIVFSPLPLFNALPHRATAHWILRPLLVHLCTRRMSINICPRAPVRPVQIFAIAHLYSSVLPCPPHIPTCPLAAQ